MPQTRLRVAELAAGLAATGDLGLRTGAGDHGASSIRTTVHAMRAADPELDLDARRALFWSCLLRSFGRCAVTFDVEPEPPIARVAAVWTRARRGGRHSAAGQVAADEIIGVVARRLGLDTVVRTAPGVAEIGATAADPTANGELAGADLDELLALEPPPHLVTDQSGVDDLLPLFGILADLTAPFLLGHSDRVARLAGRAADVAGLWPHDVVLVRRAGWVHDIGRVGVPARIWTKTAPLTEAEHAAVRLHPYYTASILAQTPHLAALADVASAHHERLDGSGYHRGLSGVAIDPQAAILAAADAYVRSGEWRPHRPARPPAEQAYRLLGMARDGALAHWAVDAVITAARQPEPVPPRLPNPLTGDEQLLLALVAAGSSEAAIAGQLGLTSPGVRQRINALCATIGASTRTSAVVTALVNGWLDLASRPLTL